MKNEPTIEARPERQYVGTRAVMPMSAFPREIPSMTARVYEWLNANRLRPSGKPFLRYHVIDMPDRMDVELGIPAEASPRASGQVESSVLPAGRYAVSMYEGVKDGVPANKRLIDWIAAQGEEIDGRSSEMGAVFEARYETFLTDASAEPDQDQWEIEVAIKLRD